MDANCRCLCSYPSSMYVEPYVVGMTFRLTKLYMYSNVQDGHEYGAYFIDVTSEQQCLIHSLMQQTVSMQEFPEQLLSYTSLIQESDKLLLSHFEPPLVISVARSKQLAMRQDNMGEGQIFHGLPYAERMVPNRFSTKSRRWVKKMSCSQEVLWNGEHKNEGQCMHHVCTI